MKQITYYFAILILCGGCVQNQEKSVDDGFENNELGLNRYIDLRNTVDDHEKIYSDLEIYSLHAKDKMDNERLVDMHVNSDYIVTLSQTGQFTYTVRQYDFLGIQINSFQISENESQITSFQLVGDNVLIGDSYNNFLLTYELDGDLVNKEGLTSNLIDFKYLPVVDQFVIQTLDHNDSSVINTVSFYSKDMDKIKDYSFFNKRNLDNTFQASGSSLEKGTTENDVLFSNAHENTLYKLTAEKKELLFELNSVTFGNQVLNKYLIADNIFWTSTKLYDRYYSIIKNLNSETTYLIHNSMVLDNFEGRFAFAFNLPRYVDSNGKFISIIDQASMRQTLSRVSPEKEIAFNDGIDLDATDHVFIYQFNFDFLQNNSSTDMSKIMPAEVDDIRSEDSQIKFQMNVFPNPTTGLITIESQNAQIENLIADRNSSMHVGIHSLSGQVLEIIELNKKTDFKLSVDLSQYPGSNFLVVVTENRSGVRKLLFQKRVIKI